MPKVSDDGGHIILPGDCDPIGKRMDALLEMSEQLSKTLTRNQAMEGLSEVLEAMEDTKNELKGVLPVDCDPDGSRMDTTLASLDRSNKPNLLGLPPGKSANEWQPGGAHYKVEQGLEEHWDRMWRLFGPAWFIGNITKYAERCMDKGQCIQDLTKVMHYTQKLMELVQAATDGSGVQPGRWPSLLAKKEDPCA